jgi:hypothetical protein
VRTPGQSRARQLIDEAVDLDAEDLVADFIESQIGRFYFNTSWQEKRDFYMTRLVDWLAKQERSDKLPQVVELIDHLATGNFAWNDRWADDYGGESDKSVAVKPKPKKRSQPNAIPNKPGHQGTA